MKPHTPNLDTQEAQFGLRAGSLLSAGLPRLPGDINERLRVARMQALESARQSRVAGAAAAKAGVVLTQGHGWRLSLGGAGSAWWRALALLPLLLLVVGLGWVQHASEREQTLAVASVDAVLLAGALPPQAYHDPGFAEFLRSGPP